jgi:dihydrofolate reductase
MVHRRKIVVYIATGADGLIGRPDGPVGWLDRAHPRATTAWKRFISRLGRSCGAGGRATGRATFQKCVPGSAFDTKVKNYVFTHSPPQSAAPTDVEFVKETNQSVGSPSAG